MYTSTFQPSATSLNATTQLKTEKPATLTQKTIIAETTPQHQPTRIEEATLMETTQVVTMPWRTLMLTSTTEDKNTIYDKITPEMTTTGKITGLQATTNHYETTNDSPTRYKATTPDMTKTDEATALHVTSRAVTNDASTTYDATIPNTTGDTITSVVTTSGDSTTTDTKTTYDVTTPVMTSTYNTTTLHLISNGLATTNERTTTHDATTPDTTSGRITMHTTASSDSTTPDMKTGYDVATPVMTSTDKATTLHLISNGLSITNEPTTSHDATAPDTTGDRITSHVTTSSDSTTTDTKTKYDVSTPVMTSTDNAATLHLISSGFATKTEITTSYDATTPDTTVDRITSYVTTSRDSTTTDTKTGYDVATPVMTSTDNAATLHLISSGFATKNEITTSYDATTPDTTGDRITSHVTTSRDSTTTDTKTKDDVSTPVMTSTDNAATLHLISSGFATKNEITTSYDATTPDTTGDRITSHITRSRGSATTDAKTRYDLTTPVMTSTDNATTFHLISNSLATTNEPSTRHEVTTAGMSTEAKSTTLHATTSSVTSTDIKASLGLSTTEYLSTKSTTRKREETTIKSTIAVTTLPNLINMERRFVLPHLALEVELLTYFLGSMDTDLSNSSITQVQTTTGDTFGSFFGGLVNSFKYATPSRFYDTVERSSFEIQSTGDIHMYMSTINSTSQFLCYPVDALSTDYIVSVPNINTKSSFIITATEGDTEVSVFFPRDFFYGGNTYNFERALRLTLNDLQTVVFNATFDVTGTYIKSSKPVSLVAEVQWDSHLSIQPYLSTFYLPPIENWGMKYSLRSYFGGFNQIHITASQNNTVITMKVSELINEIKKILNAWNSYKYNCSRDCLVEIESSRPIMVLQTECPTDGYCNTMVTPSTTQAVTQEVPVFVSTYLVGNLGVWVSNGNYDNIKVDNQTVMWDVIRNGVFVEATVDKGYHFISSSNGEQQFLVTVDKTVYAAHSTHSGTNYKACLFDRVFISGVEVTFQATTPGNSVGSLEKCKEDTTNGKYH
ncbi:hypothetical protein HOLleu_37194 [Holothuria leucospilota]|uniref:IgGFc-binding protein N-terminal domain-containing protein n=1 Tax=Holothuria leucospilota TaxID=206669 RepID=A0A9Q0YGR3_HOLLE|nr:hypothetical protein HOLleu_37194 [Holothuria leucospilota]